MPGGSETKVHLKQTIVLTVVLTVVSQKGV